MGGVIKEQEELTLQTPESFWDRFRIDVRVRQEVTAINPTEKTVTVHALDSGKVYTETYDKLLLAPGAKPTVPALSGVSSERVFTLRTVEDTLRIRRFVAEKKPKTAVLAGGGFIGLEMAENLVEMGVSVTIVQRPKQLLRHWMRIWRALSMRKCADTAWLCGWVKPSPDSDRTEIPC